ncbi:MAG: cation:proton antiporter, partial [Phycisphaeraceae bacterium]|nr:cation:proton antiporter [Phycisphaeraceae bacterium]
GGGGGGGGAPGGGRPPTTEWIGIHAIFGAFIVGVALGDSEHLRERTRQTIHQFITNIFAPVFFAGIGLRISFIEHFDLLLVLLVLFIAILTKVTGCTLGALLGGLSRREALAVGFGMTGRGAMEIILAGIAFQAELITERLFVAIVIMALVTSLLAGPAMQKILQRRQRRRLASILSERQFIPELRAWTRRDAIEEMCQVAGELLDRDPETLTERVWQRERMMPTSMGDGLAVPHARLEGLERPMIVVGRSRRGVDLDAADGKPGRILCLLLTSTNDPDSQLELLDMVARAFADEQSREDALRANSFIEFMAAIRVSEQHSTDHDG